MTNTFPSLVGIHEERDFQLRQYAAGRLSLEQALAISAYALEVAARMATERDAALTELGETKETGEWYERRFQGALDVRDANYERVAGERDAALADVTVYRLLAADRARELASVGAVLAETVAAKEELEEKCCFTAKHRAGDQVALVEARGTIKELNTVLTDSLERGRLDRISLCQQLAVESRKYETLVATLTAARAQGTQEHELAENEAAYSDELYEAVQDAHFRLTQVLIGKRPGDKSAEDNLPF